MTPTIDIDTAIALVTELVAVPGPPGREGAIAARVTAELTAAGIPANAIVHDQAHRRSPFGGEVGNLIVRLDGRGTLAQAPRLLVSCHLDTVPLCVGCQPRRDGNRLVPASRDTALGGDNRSGVAAIVTLARELARQRLDHAPLTLLFTVQEEVGLVGAGGLDTALLGAPAFGLNVDGGMAEEICHGAIGGAKWEITIRGRAAHAGVHPEEGISAATIFALALAELANGGWHGLVERDGQRGTANVGIVEGGQATNVVMDTLRVVGECRSHDEAFRDALVARYRAAFEAAAARVANTAGQRGSLAFREQNRYPAFRLERDSAVVDLAARAIAALGLEPRYKISNGGQDANFLNRQHNIPTITLGAGAHNLHTVDEYLDLDEYLTGCRLLLALATGSGGR